ncbi:MAG TPA: GspH/FimT family pseudopilin [Candidatus Luteimonas excrementigallinarum]|nr:GspH/FimT family pseudopilin [Candidatus Luteimonas excrementigallinarum]
MTRKDAGLTLIELLVTLAIGAITLTIGLPTFSGTLQHMRVSTTMHRVSADLALARNTAIMRRSQVVVCPRTADYRCRSDSDWSHGWIVFTDDNGNRQPDTEQHILRVTDPPTARNLAITSSRRFLRYQRDGRSAHSNQTVRVCNGTQLAGSVVINNVGRVRSSRPDPGTPCPG